MAGAGWRLEPLHGMAYGSHDRIGVSHMHHDRRDVRTPLNTLAPAVSRHAATRPHYTQQTQSSRNSVWGASMNPPLGPSTYGSFSSTGLTTPSLAASPAGGLAGAGLTSTRGGLDGSRGAGIGSGGPRLPVGLTNLGNTCFMNAVLQCLVRTPLLARGVMEHPIPPTSRGLHGELSRAFKKLVHDCQTYPSASWGDQSLTSSLGRGMQRPCSWGDEEHVGYLASGHASAVKPVEMFNAIRKWRPSFSGYGQQDAQEFLRFMLEGVHEELNRVLKMPPYEELDDRDHETAQQTSNRWWRYHNARDDSLIYDIFGGQLKSDVQCQECYAHHYAFDPYLDLSIPLPKTSGFPRQSVTRLSDCLQQYVEEEVLDGSNSYRCRQCKRPTRAIKQLNIYRLPQCLVIHLKRFGFGQSKLTDTVDVPLTLDMAPYLDVTAHRLRENAVTQYRLYGIVNHMGTLHSGHYTSWAKGASAEWHQYDDASVSVLNASNIPPTSDRPYLLFYEKCSAAANGLPPVHRDVVTWPSRI